MDFFTAVVIVVIVIAIVYLAAMFFGYKLLQDNPWYGVAGFFLLLLLIDIAVPDPLPIVDEVLLGLGAILTGKKAVTGKFGFKNWK